MNDVVFYKIQLIFLNIILRFSHLIFFIQIKGREKIVHKHESYLARVADSPMTYIWYPHPKVKFAQIPFDVETMQVLFSSKLQQTAFNK